MKNKEKSNLSNSEIFLNIYNKLDEFIRRESGNSYKESFSHVVKNSKNKIIPRFKDELISLGELRNAIVHSPKYGGQAIAEPHQSTVDKINFIYKAITSPPKVIPEFQFAVVGAKEDDEIKEILAEMRRSSFSQFPVFNKDNEVIEIISNNTISRWLANNIADDGTLLLENVKVSDFMQEIEFENNYKFVSRNSSIYEAYDIFIQHINKHKRNLDGIFITNSGNRKEKLLGLITIEDIANKV
ncbi:CBS domain-containing protein [Weeksellaceae bacterium KMM 9713]|uniref:CBS domain-containing protein n=1 Tax=Profundicola chukchiensis TaxID=2961959 RepID=A0A9X4MX37_9FLAO|nr:CBS domain-containing protein [Profundicola chukchiensis]MDG4945708.1 CBS domain-containing protein [Profundicola chukchiensis]